jgi:hypothetical protein
VFTDGIRNESVYLAAGLLLPCLGAAPITRRLFLGRDLGSLLERLAASMAFGLGATSVGFFLWRFTNGPLNQYVYVEAVATVACILFALRLRRQTQVAGVPPTPRVPRSIVAATTCCVVVSLFSASYLVKSRFIETPEGDWDAWAIWNLRAAFLASSSPTWRTGFSPALAATHPDYPLLIPGTVARLWVITGEVNPNAARAVAAMILAAVVLSLSGSLLRRGGAVVGAAGLSLLLVPEYVQSATSQCADVPLGLFVLLACSFLAPPTTATRTVGAGVACGLAAWTKNEGMIPALVVPLLSILVAIRRNGYAAALERARLMAIGLTPMLIVIAVFRIGVASNPDLLSGIAGSSPIAKLGDAERHFAVGQFMTAYLVGHWGGWLLLSPSWVVAGWLVAAMVRRRRQSDAVVVGTITVVTIFTSYYLIYILTPYELNWHMQTSWPRLLTHVWPTLVRTAIVWATEDSSASRGRAI